MRRLLLIGAILMLVCGCGPVRQQVDLNGYRDFEWDRVVRVTSEYEGLLLGYRVKTIELKSRDGRTIRIMPGQPQLSATMELKVTSTRATP